MLDRGNRTPGYILGAHEKVINETGEKMPKSMYVTDAQFDRLTELAHEVVGEGHPDTDYKVWVEFVIAVARYKETMQELSLYCEHDPAAGTKLAEYLTKEWAKIATLSPEELHQKMHPEEGPSLRLLPGEGGAGGEDAQDGTDDTPEAWVNLDENADALARLAAELELDLDKWSEAFEEELGDAESPAPPPVTDTTTPQPGTDSAADGPLDEYDLENFDLDAEIPYDPADFADEDAEVEVADRSAIDDILGIDPPQSDTRDWLASLAADLPDAVDGGPAMAGKPEVIVWLELSEEADGMVHFKADGGDTSPVREVYLDKVAHTDIGSPTHIRLTIEEE